MRTVLHHINLNVVGGVETLFSDLLRSHWLQGSYQHQLAVGTALHEAFLDPVSSGSEVHYLKKSRLGLYLPRRPRFIRQRRASALAGRIDPSLIVAWNTLGRAETLRMKQASRRAALMYLEHGAAWDADPHMVAPFLRECEQVVCNSMAAKRVMEERFGAVVDGVIRVPLRPGALRPEQPAQPKEWPARRPLKLGIAGRHIPLKGFLVVPHVLRALLAQGYDVELRVAGTGPELPNFEDLGHQLGVSSRIHCLGHVSDMAAFFQEIDMLLVPSIREPFGLVSVEAAAHGCIVVASEVDGLPETMAHGHSGVLVRPTEPVTALQDLGGSCKGIPARVYDPAADTLDRPRILDPAAMAKAIAALIDDPARFRQMSRNAIGHARQEHDFLAYAQALGAVVERVACD